MIASSVPHVPGAKRTSPTPKPSAMKCAGCDSRKRASGCLEMVVAESIDLDRLAVGSQQAHALAAPDLADLSQGNAEHLLQVVDALARVRMRREAELVVVAAGNDRGAAKVGPHVLACDVADRDLLDLDG